MTCTVAPGVVVCSPGGALARRILYCGECQRRHRFVVRSEVWYAPTVYGLCGDTWCDGERMRRPFARGWRERAIRHARALWDRATSPAVAHAALRAELDLYRLTEEPR